MKALSLEQVQEALHQQENTTLKYDSTTEKVDNLVEVEVSTKDRTYLLGVREQSRGRATDYIRTIHDTIRAVEQTNTPNDGTGDILATVSNTRQIIVQPMQLSTKF